MGMVHCRGCGQQIHESAPTCPHCGAPQGIAAAMPAADAPMPEGVRGWSWGAFLFNWLWAIFNSVWIGLLALVPFVGFVMAIVLGFKGREWAWKAKRWDSVEHFQRVQRRWSAWGVGLLVVPMAIGVLAAVALPAYKDYQSRAAERRAALAAEQQAAQERVARAEEAAVARAQAEAAAAAAAARAQQPAAAPSPQLQATPQPQAPAAAPADTAPVRARYSGTVDKMNVDVHLETRADGSVDGYWEVTNRPNLAGQRYRLAGVRRGEALLLREYSERGAHEMDVELRVDAAAAELVGEARPLAPGSRTWAIRLRRA